MSEVSGALPAVVTALREELAPLLARGTVERRLMTEAGRFYRLKLGDRGLIAGFTGDGAIAAATGMRALLAAVEIEHLLLMGVAGGLSPELAPGALLLAREVRDGLRSVVLPDGTLMARAQSGDVTVGILVSHERIATTPEEKAELYRTVGDGAAAVDLETAAWVCSAAESGVPYVAVRSVSDGASEALPLDFNRFQDARGQVQRGKIVLFALLRPWRIPQLAALGRRTRQCGERLADFAEMFFR